MLRREDRRDLACLGLWVAVYGLALAPVLHAVHGHGASPAARADAPAPPSLPLSAPHDERVPHSHAPGEPSHPEPEKSAGHTHGVGSVEHLQAVALPALALPPLAVFWLEAGTRHLGQERPRAGSPPRPTAMPQAP